ncbi:hypothetical protein HYDPIDRAFT_29125 [Hydnomerulius pinastri MD-312]|uniref:G domain-containing protein n=1 Tax=Hydnomerulius pinastri MD-312 TaxID=994086 RepID=A0A0C9WEA8_9AGAM|nr:hypothetical protein HYDPIDRAFT_29125 [Hydnomerulius pinastri MD-312]
MNFLDLFKKFTSSTETMKISDEDIVVFLVGPSGSGKSWFISEVAKSDKIVVSKGQHPCTKKVQAFKCSFDSGPNSIVFVDTPSFHTEDDDINAEDKMKTWIKTRYTTKCKRVGVLYLHRIATDPAVDPKAIQRHLNTFANAFSGIAYVPQRLHVVATLDKDSDKIKDNVIELRKSRLQDQMKSLDGGRVKWRSSMYLHMFEGNPDTAWDAVQELLNSET